MIHKQFCDGIAKWSKNETASGETRELIKDLILKWHDAGCSQDKEDHAWKVIQKNDTLVVEYITTWKGICYKICPHLRNCPRKFQKFYKLQLTFSSTYLDLGSILWASKFPNSRNS